MSSKRYVEECKIEAVWQVAEKGCGVAEVGVCRNDCSWFVCLDQTL